jgi:mRNA-degrading endonuclease RelE of RelBE toxin-antitoxin system
MYEQRIILDAASKYLEIDAHVESKRRRQLRPNPVAPWELRVGDYRVFYKLEESASVVRVLAIGYKEHNDVFIRGRKVEV